MSKPEPDASRPCPICKGTGKPIKSQDQERQWYRCRACGMRFTKGKAPNAQL